MPDPVAARGPFRRPNPAAFAPASSADAAIRLTEPRFGAILHVRVPAAMASTALGDIPVPGRTGPDRLGSLVTSTAPGDCLVFVPEGLADAAVEAWSGRVSAAGGTVVDVTHGRAVLRLDGPAVCDMLAHVCPVDLKRIPPGHALRTSLARIAIDIVREPGLETSYLVHVDRSYGWYLLAVLLDAGQDDGIQFVPLSPVP